MGRRKIEIQPLTDDRNRTVTFVKRKAGLFKKAHELAVLCQVELAVIIVGNNNKLYEFSSVDTNELIKVYQNTPKVHESKSPANYGNYKKK
ncbi:myocyte enhancer factor 2D, partial [Yamadazyma tenuis ATCC 10573]